MSGSPTLSSLFTQRIIVDVGDLSVSNDTSLTLSAYALGSCVGVVAYDPVARMGGILRLMLPDSVIAPEKAAAQPAVFADTGLPLLFRSLVELGVDATRLRLFIAGGANLLGTSSGKFTLGERNLKATAAYLAQHDYSVRFSDVGGTVNRSIHLEIGTGTVSLVTPAMNESYLLAA